MGTAFNDKERKIIAKKLKEIAKECARTIGMRKTTVDDLTKKVNISKGAFYHFYPSKEHLFFEVLEDWHDQMYAVAFKTMEENKELSKAKRVEIAIFAVIKQLERYNLLSFLENEVEIILRKLPDEMMQKHYQKDKKLISLFLEQTNVSVSYSEEVITGLLHSIFYTMSSKDNFGDSYPEVLKVLVESICMNVFKE